MRHGGRAQAKEAEEEALGLLPWEFTITRDARAEWAALDPPLRCAPPCRPMPHVVCVVRLLDPHPGQPCEVESTWGHPATWRHGCMWQGNCAMQSWCAAL